jgi:glycolate oxidase FAD binding subunit
LKYEPEELVLTRAPLRRLLKFRAELAEKRQMLAFEPADWGPLFGNKPARDPRGYCAQQTPAARVG